MIKNKVIQLFKDYREEHNLSQQALGDKLEIKQQMIARIESGLNTPTIQNLEKYLNSMGYDITITKRDNMSRDRGTRFYCLAECCDNCLNFNTKESTCTLDNLKTLKNYCCQDFEGRFVPTDNTLHEGEL